MFRSDFPSGSLFSARGVREVLFVSTGAAVAPDLRNAFAEQAGLLRSVLDPESMLRAEFPKSSARAVRLLVDFSRALDQNHDGTFGRRVVSHG